MRKEKSETLDIIKIIKNDYKKLNMDKYNANKEIILEKKKQRYHAKKQIDI